MGQTLRFLVSRPLRMEDILTKKKITRNILHVDIGKQEKEHLNGWKEKNETETSFMLLCAIVGNSTA